MSRLSHRERRKQNRIDCPQLGLPRATRDIFHAEEGFSTLGMVVALLVTLALIFSGAQVYRVQSASADIQDVADAAALAAENEVAEFMIAVRLADGVVLSLSLSGLTCFALGVAALCVPVTAPISEVLLSAGSKFMEARASFSKTASKGLDALQKALPFLAAANAATIGIENSGGPMNANYLALGLLVPAKGEMIAIDEPDGVDDLEDTIDEESDELKERGEEAEAAAEKANEAKLEAFKHDCGNNPEYCLYERAQTLAGMTGSGNPVYRSVDAWSFSVPLKRAQAYYQYRLQNEAPQSGGVEEGARSALRKIFYQYAVDQLAEGYVRETESAFDAYFPHLPKNTSEMRSTSLYALAAFPITYTGAGPMMHAWSGCPNAAGAMGTGSIAQMEAGAFETCSACGFTAASLGKVAAASTSIENGFEYHYEIVAQAADEYEAARKELDQQSDQVKKQVDGIFNQIGDLLAQAVGYRINAQPPGRFGSIALVVNLSAAPASSGFKSSFVTDGGVLGMRAAISGATLIEESSEEGRNLIASLLDNLSEKGGVGVGIAGAVLRLWSAMLQAYLDGQEGMESGIAALIDAIPFASKSGLGTWASGRYKELTKTLGLEPANLNALKPILVNTSEVASKGEGSFVAAFLSVKGCVESIPAGTSDVFSSLLSSAQIELIQRITGDNGRLEIARIEIPFSGESIPLAITLPSAAASTGEGAIASIADAIRGVYVQITGVRVWE